VDTVRRLVEARVAPTQDALIERAIRDLERQLRDERDAQSWADAAQDPVFQAELREIEEGWAIDDLRAWEDGQV
jgi:hypothetical protein